MKKRGFGESLHTILISLVVITYYHKLNGLKQYRFVTLQSGAPSLKWAGLRREPTASPFPASTGRLTPWSVVPHPAVSVAVLSPSLPLTRANPSLLIFVIALGPPE